MLFVSGKMMQAGDQAQPVSFLSAGAQGRNTALTLQVVLRAQLASVSPTVLTEGVS